MGIELFDTCSCEQRATQSALKFIETIFQGAELLYRDFKKNGNDHMKHFHF